MPASGTKRDMDQLSVLRTERSFCKTALRFTHSLKARIGSAPVDCLKFDFDLWCRSSLHQLSIFHLSPGLIGTVTTHLFGQFRPC